MIYGRWSRNKSLLSPDEESRGFFSQDTEDQTIRLGRVNARRAVLLLIVR